MKRIIFIPVTFFFCVALCAQSPKIISDCTISFAVSSTNNSKQVNLGTKIIYIKGKDIRVDFISNVFIQTTFYNSNAGNATILKEVGHSKYISNYTAEDWKKQNEIYNNASISFTVNTKKILNYDCKQALITLKNGSIYTIYYTSALIPSVTENPFEFKDVPGLILEYESSISESEKVTYTAEKIDFNPVPTLQFAIPKTGYRILH